MNQPRNKKSAAIRFLVRFLAAASLLTSGAAASPQIPTLAQKQGFAWATDSFTTPHFKHSFRPADLKRINPMKRIGSASHPYSTMLAGQVIDDFVLETAYYLECAWETYEAGFKKLGLQMPAPVRDRIPVEYEAYSADKVPLQFRHEGGGAYRERIAVWLQPDRLSRALHLQRTAHELFHFIEGHAVGGSNCSSDSAPGKWWIEAAAEYAACNVVWTEQNLRKHGVLSLMQVGGRTYPNGLSDEKGGGSVRAYPYLLEYPLRRLGLPANDHAMDYFLSDNWDKGEEVEYDKGYFIQYLVDQCRADFFKMSVAVFTEYRISTSPLAVFDALDKYLRTLTPNLTLAEAYRGFAHFYLLSEKSPLVRHVVYKGPVPVSAAPLVSVIKAPQGAEREAAKIPPGELDPPLEFPIPVNAGFSAKMLAVQLQPYSGSGPRHARALQVDAPKLDHGEVGVFLGQTNQWLSGTRVVPKGLIRHASFTPEVVSLGDDQTLYLIVTGTDAENDGAAVIRISDSPSLKVTPPALRGARPIARYLFQAVLRNWSIPGAVKFLWKLSGPTGAKPVPGETKALDMPMAPLSTSQSVSFPQAGKYELKCTALDAKGAAIAESDPVPCEVEGEIMGQSAPAGPAAGSGYWRLSGIHVQKLKPSLAPSDLVEFAVSVSEGSMSGKVTGDSHVGEGPATWGGQCSWTWKAPHGLDRLIPGETIEGRMTLTDQSLPEQVSGWQHGYTGVTGTVRIDRPLMPMGMVDAGAQDLLNLSAPYKQTKTQEGKLTVPAGSKSGGWDGKISLVAASGFGRFERIYEWTTEAYVPGRKVPVTGDVKPGETVSGDVTAPAEPIRVASNPGSVEKAKEKNEPAPSLGRVWRVHEASSELAYDGVWTRRGSSNTFDAAWSGGAIRDSIVVESISGDRIVLFRPGNGGRYYGTLSPDRKQVISGTMSWAPTFHWTATIE